MQSSSRKQKDYKNYEQALKTLEQEKLVDRRITAAIKFWEKCVVNSKHADMFPSSNAGGENIR